MNDLPLGERLTRIEDEIALVDSSLDAKTLELWTAFNSIVAMVEELRDQVRTTPEKIHTDMDEHIFFSMNS